MFTMNGSAIKTESMNRERRFCLRAIIVLAISFVVAHSAIAAVPGDENYDDNPGQSFPGTNSFSMDGISYTITGSHTYSHLTSNDSFSPLGDDGADYYLRFDEEGRGGISTILIEAADGSAFQLVGLSIDGIADADILITPAGGPSVHITSNGDFVTRENYDLSGNTDFQNITSFTISGGNLVLDLDDLDFDEPVTNSAPAITGAPSDVTVIEDVATSLDLSAATVADADGDILTVTLEVSAGTMTASTGDGVTVSGSGTGSLTLTGTAGDVDAFLDTPSNIQYTSASNANGSNADTLTITPNDGTEDGTVVNIDINISAVNDDPSATGLPTDVTVVEDTATSLDLSAINLSDPDSGSDPVTLTIAVSAGTLSLANASDLSFTGNATDTITISGAIGAINAYLDIPTNMLYTGLLNAYGDDAAMLTLTINDNGNTGSGGGADVNLGSVNVDITAVNDAPVDISLSSSTVGQSGGANAVVGTLITTDVDSSTFTYTLVPGIGDADNGLFNTSGDQLRANDAASLALGTYSVRVQAYDGADAYDEAFSVTVVDDVAPSGHSVSFDDATLNGIEATSIGFTFASAEVGADYSYTISSDGGGTPVAGSGTIVSAGDQISGIDVSDLADGTLTLSVVVTDTAGNAAGAVTDTATLKAMAPTPSITTSAGDPTNSAFTATVNFGEVVTGFEMADISAGNATLSDFVDSGSGSYAVTVTPNGDGTVTLNIGAGVAQDAVGNATNAASQFSLTYDGTRPTPALSTLVSDPANGPFPVSIDFGERVPGFAIGHITTSNASLGGFTDSGDGSYSVTVTPVADGTVTLNIAANVVQDEAGNNNNAASELSIGFDGSAPGLISSNPASGATSVARDASLVLNFSENIVAGSGAASLYTTGGSLVESISVTSPRATISGSSVTVDWSDELVPTRSYYVLVSDGAFQDAAGNAYGGIADSTTLSFTVANAAPVAADDDASVSEDNAVAIPVLANDTDAESALNAASLRIIAAPTNGRVSLSTGSGVVTYTPAADYSGTDSFTYRVQDIYGATSNTATVTVTVVGANDAPVAVADHASTPEDNAVTIAVVANDLDIDADDGVDPESLAIISPPANGVLAVGVGEVTYTPDLNFSGTDSFTYTVRDQSGATSNVARVMVNVVGGNALPVAENDAAALDEDDGVTVEVLANDSDSDGNLNTTSVTIVTGPSHGATAVDALTGAVTYTPNPDYYGSDSFVYVVQDDIGGTSNPATVELTVNGVNDAPIARPDTVLSAGDEAINISVLGNDHDLDGSLDIATIIVETDGAEGSAVANVDGTVTYTPGAGFAGDDVFSYSVMDNGGLRSAPATVTIVSEAANDAPLANDDAATTNRDQPVTINLLANDADVDGELSAGTLAVVQPANGSVEDKGDGTVTYTPNAGYVGLDSFTYTVSDDDGDASNVATVSIRIDPVNGAPSIAGSPPAAATVGQIYSFVPSATDPDGDPLTFSATGLPDWLSLNTATGEVVGTPADANIGVHSGILLTVTDGVGSASLPAFAVNVAAGVDTDGDGISDYQEGLDGTDPLDPLDYWDIEPPTLVAPADLTLDAVGLYTPVTLRRLLGLQPTSSRSRVEQALAELTSDNLDGDGCCAPAIRELPGQVALLPPGRHQLTWVAEDRMGNMTEATQVVNLRPLVSLSMNQTTVEGATASFSVILNGPAPVYPFTVPYKIDPASTADATDHDLVDGEVTFTNLDGTAQTRAQVQVRVANDGVSEDDEILIVRLDDRTSHAEDLANGYDPDAPDIYDINSGARTAHQIRIVEGNLPPRASLRLFQNGVPTTLVARDGGSLTVTAAVVDPNPDDQHSYDWSDSDNRLVETDGNPDDAALTVEPDALTAGRYLVQVRVMDAAGASTRARFHFLVVDSLPELSGDTDSDGDGIDDATEGAADSDSDGIADYLDNISAASILPEQVRDTEDYLIECDPGLHCRLGQFALLSSTGAARLTEDDLGTQEDLGRDPDFMPVGGIFDFEIQGLAEVGESVQVVIPQRVAIPDNAVYRKFRDGVWTTFVENGTNALHSAPGEAGHCPPPGDLSWRQGLTAGDLCVQLTLEDGGPNDADGVANAAIADPGAVSVAVEVQPEPEQPGVSRSIRSEGGGGAAGGLWWIFLSGLGLLRGRSRAYIKRMYNNRGTGTSLLVLVLVGSVLWLPNVSYGRDLAESLQGRMTLELTVGRAEGDRSAGAFADSLAQDDVAVELARYDASRPAWQAILGYEVNRWAILYVGYLDLGKVKVDFQAQAPDDGTLESALQAAYPATGKGWLLGYRYSHSLADRLRLNGDVGLFRWRQDIDVTGVSVDPQDDSGTDPMLALGVDYTIERGVALGARAQRIFLDREDVDMFGVTLVWRF